jgi:hypothetical protein
MWPTHTRFSHPSRPALEPTQPPLQWVPGLSRGQSGRGVVLTTHPLLAPRSRKGRAIPLSPLWAFGSVTGYLYLYLYLHILVRMHIWWHFFVFIAPSVCCVLSVISPYSCPVISSVYLEWFMFLLMLWMFSVCASLNATRLAWWRYWAISTCQSVMVRMCLYIPSCCNAYCTRFECRYQCVMKLLNLNFWTVLCLF